MEECKKALSEVSAIINNIPEELQEKISDNFLHSIFDNTIYFLSLKIPSSYTIGIFK